MDATLHSNRQKLFIGILAALIVILLAGTLWLYARNVPGLDNGTYQAVYVIDGKVYFGKLSIQASNYVLTDVYYLQSGSIQSQNQKPDIKLVKLGDEIHGPEDAIFFEKSNVMYWENLKETGQIIQAIKTFKSQPQQATPKSSQQSGAEASASTE